MKISSRDCDSYKAWRADGANIIQIESGRELHDKNHSDWHVRL